MSLNLTLSASGAALPAGLEWTLSYPTSLLGPITLAAGPALTTANKSLNCAAGSGTVTCIAVGLNSSVISSGVVATVTVPILSSSNTSTATLIPVSAFAVLPQGYFTAISSTGGTLAVQAPSHVSISSVSVSPTSVVGGSNINVMVTLSGAAPAGGVPVTLATTSSSVPGAAVTVGAGATSQTFVLPTFAVTASTLVVLTASSGGSAATSLAFAITPSSPTTTQSSSTTTSGTATFLGADSTTQGSWWWVYGGDGFNVINNLVSYPSYVNVTPLGMVTYPWAQSTGDPRALQKAYPASDRIAACWYNASAFSVRLHFTDSETHRVALYLVDFDGMGRSETVQVLDPSGNVLDTRNVAGFSGGQYLIWNLTGDVVLRVSNDNPSGNAVASGLFFGGAAINTSTGTTQLVTDDTTTAGSWKSVYGLDGYSVIGDAVSYPSYVTVTPAGNESYVWAPSTTDPRALSTVGSSGQRIAACWYGQTFTINLAFQDNLTHQVALYLLDYDGLGRSEFVQVLDANGFVRNTQLVSNFSNGQYLVWSFSGQVTLRISNASWAANSNAVVSGIFFGGPFTATGSASFLGTDVATSGSWHGVYGSEGFGLMDGETGYPPYAVVTPAGNYSYTWAAPTTDLRAPQTVYSLSTREATCWYGSTFTINLAFEDGLQHQVSLYLLDFDYQGRSETVQVLDMSGNVLDTRTVSNFFGGQYLIWNLGGQVLLKIMNDNAAPNAVVSGLFFH